VYGIVQQSDGTIRVDSTEGQGTTFTIALPVAVERASHDHAAATEGEPPRGSEMILLVEDEEHVRLLAQRTLESCGYAVVAARSGIEALDIARRMEGHIDVLLTDIIMPQLSGPQLVERFLPAHPGTCVIYMSGYSDEAIVNYQLDRGHAFLRKPFTPFMLAQTVRDSLDATGTVTHATHSDR
jgi:CheY-like chemotaxis protein